MTHRGAASLAAGADRVNSVGSGDTHAMAHGHRHGERALPPTVHLVTMLLLVELTAH